MINQFKNIMKYSLTLALWLIFSINTTPLLADEIPGVGIDWEASTMQVEFDEENIMVPASTCFSTTPTSCVTQVPYIDDCVIEDLDTLGYSDVNPSPAIEDCFHEAGDYQVTIQLIDFAGNLAAPIISTLTVMAGTPDQDHSELRVFSCPTDGTAPIANNDGACTLYFIIKDQYDNPVSQLETEDVNMYLDTLLSMDANDPEDAAGIISFREGLLMNGDFVEDGNPTKTAFTLGVDYVGGLGVYETLNFRALAPTLEKVGDVLSKNDPFQLDFIFEVPSIDVDGTVNIASPITFRYGQYSPEIKFKPMISSNVEIPGTPEFIIDVANPINVVRSISNATGLAAVSNILMGVTHHYLPWELMFDPSFFINESMPSISFTTLDAPGDQVSPQSATVTIRDDTVNYTENLSFSSIISYTINHGGTDYSISYPGGAIGSGFGADCADDPECVATEITVKLIGASVEGSVLGGVDTTRFGTDDSSTLLGANKFTDIREDIFKNAHRISRGLPAETSATFTNFADLTWTDDVVLAEGDVAVTVDGDLPIGIKTLIIKNGNFVVHGNLTYLNKTDSFGVILINDEVKPFPEKGNIFVENTVKKIAGTYFLEGTIMTNNALPGANPTIYDGVNGLTTNDTQFLLEGAILSNSTLGGGYESFYPAGTLEYLTPWGSTADLTTDVGYLAWTGAGKTKLEIAKAYDLHMVRYYHPTYDGFLLQDNGDMCVCVPGGTSCSAASGDGADCDSNDNAFVIRTDGRMKQLPPPGFETVSTIKWE